MKYLLTITLTLITFALVAQSGTTLDEYRYLSKGYAYQVEMGLDPTKNGYEIRKNYTAKDGTIIIGLYRNNTKILQGLLFVATDSNGKAYYQALPNPKSTDNVLALFRQDQAPQLPKTVLDRITAAKDQYLFKMMAPTTGEEVVQVAEISSQPTEYAQNSRSKTPKSYKRNNPTTQDDDQLTAKGGSLIISEAQSVDIANSENTQKSKLGGHTITGQLNTELTRAIQVPAQAQNATKAKGKVMIKFCADSEGKVTYAKFTQRGSTTLNSQLKGFALAAVRKMRLAPSATIEDCGTVGFDF